MFFDNGNSFQGSTVRSVREVREQLYRAAENQGILKLLMLCVV